MITNAQPGGLRLPVSESLVMMVVNR